MQRVRLLVGVHAGGLNGIDTYAEQVAIAAGTAGHEVTLLATDAASADRLRARLAADRVLVDHLGLAPLTPRQSLLERAYPTSMVRRLNLGLARFAARARPGGIVWHFNRPSLALPVAGRGERTCVAAWFYPHRAIARFRESWAHAGGSPLRRAAIATKALDFYRWDQSGYRAADWIVAPTEQLTLQLRSQGHRVLSCPPPARVPETAPLAQAAGEPRFVVCSGDLSHPRKNMADAVKALAGWTARRGPATLVAIGRNPAPLQKLAAEIAPQLKMEAPGVLEPVRVQEEMRRSSALLFPSRYEEWGYVAVESLLGGTPVVTYPVYPFAEMLSGGLGAVAEDRSVAGLTQAIERSLSLVRGPDLVRAAAARFGSATVGRRLGEVWGGAETPG